MKQRVKLLTVIAICSCSCKIYFMVYMKNIFTMTISRYNYGILTFHNTEEMVCQCKRLSQGRQYNYFRGPGVSSKTDGCNIGSCMAGSKSPRTAHGRNVSLR